MGPFYSWMIFFYDRFFPWALFSCTFFFSYVFFPAHFFPYAFFLHSFFPLCFSPSALFSVEAFSASGSLKLLPLHNGSLKEVVFFRNITFYCYDTLEEWSLFWAYYAEKCLPFLQLWLFNGSGFFGK